jgi:hypothetical protein
MRKALKRGICLARVVEATSSLRELCVERDDSRNQRINAICDKSASRVRNFNRSTIQCK